MFSAQRTLAHMFGIVIVACTTVILFVQPLSARADGTRYDNGKVAFTVVVDKQQVAPGSVIKLTIKCSPRPGYHTYPLAKDYSANLTRDRCGSPVTPIPWPRTIQQT